MAEFLRFSKHKELGKSEIQKMTHYTSGLKGLAREDGIANCIINVYFLFVVFDNSKLQTCHFFVPTPIYISFLIYFSFSTIN